MDNPARELTLLALGLFIGMLSGVWIGGAGRIWREAFSVTIKRRGRIVE